MVALYRLQAHMLEYLQQHQFIARLGHKSSGQYDCSNLIRGWIMASSNLMQYKWRCYVNVPLALSISTDIEVWCCMERENRGCDGWCFIPQKFWNTQVHQSLKYESCFERTVQLLVCSSRAVVLSFQTRIIQSKCNQDWKKVSLPSSSDYF